MLIIGLTGGIGSGKTTVAKIFAEHGIEIIDTDKIAHELVEPLKPAFKKIVAHFGEAILTSDGKLDRKKLRNEIFNNEIQRRWLEKTLHPAIREEVIHQVKQITSPYCIVIIPLLVESKPNPLVDRVLLIDAPREQQINRTQTRDNISVAEVETILATQASHAERLAMADDVIRNDGALADLIPQVEKLHQFYLSLCRAHKT